MEELPPSGVVDRDPGEVYSANRVWVKYRESSVMEGVCPECSGPMPVASIRICEDHDADPNADEVCDRCGSIFWGVAFHVCEVCKNFWKMPTLHYPTLHPGVLAFYYDHGIEFDFAAHEQRSHMLDYREDVVQEDPLRIRTTITLDGDELAVTFDEGMRVVDLSRSD